MQAKDFIHYTEQPQLLDQQGMKELQQLVQDFPYFQSAHLLLSVAAKKWDASVYQQSLKKTAIVASSRSHLFHLIQQTETAMEQAMMEKINPEPNPVQEPVALVKPAEESKQELDILKAAEISSEQAITKNKPVQKPAPDAEQELEKEIQKAVVTSFVEKEILKTPELHKPKPKEEPGNFVEWLALIKKNNGQPGQVIEEKARPKLKPDSYRANPVPEGKKQVKLTPDEDVASKKEKQKAIIDRIIENNPGIIRGKEEQKFYAAEIKARESLLESEHLVTETLARIYALQGSVNKAVRAYEILSLKYPQKSAYFATLIQKLKSNQ
jgi:hypothetical protein